MSNNPNQSWSEWSDENSEAIEATQAAPAEPCSESTGPARALTVADGSAVKRARQILTIFNRWRRAEGVWADRTYDDMPFRDADIGHAIAAGNAALESVDDLLTFFPANHPARIAAEKRLWRQMRRLSPNNKT